MLVAVAGQNTRPLCITRAALLLVLGVCTAAAQQRGPTEEAADIFTCLDGPSLSVDLDCEPFDRDGDTDNDLHDIALMQQEFGRAAHVTCAIIDDADDGTDVEGRLWYPDGYGAANFNRMGVCDKKACNIAFRFHLPDVLRGEQFTCARLILPAMDTGFVPSPADLRVVGADLGAVEPFSDVPPALLPRTQAEVAWTHERDWPNGAQENPCAPLWRYSPNIAPVINEIVARADWGSDPNNVTLAIIIEGAHCSNGTYLDLLDYNVSQELDCPGRITAPQLELFRTQRATFVGKELLGRPTDTSVTVNAVPLKPMQAFFEYGPHEGAFTTQTETLQTAGDIPLETLIDGLQPNTRYDYRIRYCPPGDTKFLAGPRRTFTTQRPPNRAFTFTIQSDSHLQQSIVEEDPDERELYEITMQHVAEDVPDFHIVLGDTFHSEYYLARNALDLDESLQRHLDQRPYLDLVCHSSPFFFALGNHEGEQGWRVNGVGDNLAIWATQARQQTYPLPVPDGFYTGNTTVENFVGLRENYYAWEWGDALFVVLDPYWYTKTKPHPYPPNGGDPGSGDNWDWTLGDEQYQWLRETLLGSDATFKFVFSHQVTGGVDTYGRGGIEAARHAIAGFGSFEWGGEDPNGAYTFDQHRPDWPQPIHNLMVEARVTIFFHGHDHVFVKQDLDGIVYQECPRPCDANYGYGYYNQGMYSHGDMVHNSGYLRTTVRPQGVTVEYIRTYLPGDGPSGEVAYSYLIPAPLIADW